MKHLLVYISPEKKFFHRDWGNEPELLVKIQIENSLSYCQREDLMLVTNFPYEYMGVESIVVGDENFSEKKITVSKINAILELFKRGIIGNDLYWFHDLDNFQLFSISEKEIKGEFAVTEYGKTTIRPSYDFRLSTGTIFFRKSSQDIFQVIKDRCYEEEINEETALGRIIKERPDIKKRVDIVDVTFNLATRRRDLMKTYESALKPVRAIHFHPFDRREVHNGKPNVEVVIRGENELGHPLITEGLLNIFNKHGI